MDMKHPYLFTNLLALAGSVIVVAVLIWGLIYFTGWSVTRIASLFNREDRAEQVIVPESQDGENETVSEVDESENQTSTPTPVPGTPDLYVQILRSGMTSANEAYVVFDIANRGTAGTVAWHFTANVPTSGQSQFYTSPTQIPLALGAHIENTLRFAPNLGGTFMVTVDPYNQVKELNESNNTANRYISNYYTPTPIPYYSY